MNRNRGRREVIGILVLCVVVGIGCAEAPEEEPAPGAGEPASARYTEIAPVVYMGAGSECVLRLDDEFDGALKAVVGGPGGRPALAVCARVPESGEWVVVDGVLGVENVAGEARVLPIPPDNASMFADAPASLEALVVGHVRVTATFGGMTGSGVIEIVAE